MTNNTAGVDVCNLRNNFSPFPACMEPCDGTSPSINLVNLDCEQFAIALNRAKSTCQHMEACLCTQILRVK